MAVLINRGPPGPRGIAGSQGPQGIPGPTGGQGPQGIPGSGTGFAITGDNREYYSLGQNETWLVDYIVDLSLLSSTIMPTLTAFTKQDAGGGVYYLRLGGTPGQVDGAILLTMVTSHVSYLSTLDQQIGSSFSNPGGKQLIKVSSNSNLNLSTKVYIRNIFIEIE